MRRSPEVRRSSGAPCLVESPSVGRSGCVSSGRRGSRRLVGALSSVEEGMSSVGLLKSRRSRVLPGPRVVGWQVTVVSCVWRVVRSGETGEARWPALSGGVRNVGWRGWSQAERVGESGLATSACELMLSVGRGVVTSCGEGSAEGRSLVAVARVARGMVVMSSRRVSGVGRRPASRTFLSSSESRGVSLAACAA